MAIVNQQNVQVKNGSTWYKVCPFPVGFIYLSQTSTSPATTFGGTWAALNEDRFLRPSNAWTTGGSKKISVDQMPSHTHELGRSTVYTGADNYPAVSDSRYDSAWWYVWAANWNTTATGGARITGPNTETAMAGIGQLNVYPRQISIGLHSLYLLDGGEC